MERLKQVRRILKEQGLDGLFLITDANIRYVSGFTGSDSYLLLTPDKEFFITDGRYTEQAANECPEFQVREWKKADLSLTKVLHQIVTELAVKKLGFEQNGVSYQLYQQLASSLAGVELVPTKGLVERIRYIKEPAEIDKISQAAVFADQAFEQILGFIKPGLTEKEVAAELAYYISKTGADGPGFPTILVSGVNTSLPHGIPSDRLITEGDLVTMDFGGLYDGYRSDMTRTIVVGKADSEQHRIYQLVKEAQLAALEVIKAGVQGNQPDRRVREIFTREGLTDKFRHGLGHGVGLQIHENPFMGVNCQDVLQAGCVITVEPGLYIPEWGGVRIEDTVVVQKEGIEILTNSTKELIEL